MVIREPTSMDPNLAGDHSIWYVDQIFEGLYKVLDDGKTIWLGAKSLDVSKDGLTWTFKLNPASKWTDGTPVTAKDYEFSWKRASIPSSPPTPRPSSPRSRERRTTTPAS